MPCRVSSDVLERINEHLTVPVWNPVNLQPRQKSRILQREEKTPWSFTAACRWDVVTDA
jgi:hypothetical protein